MDQLISILCDEIIYGTNDQIIELLIKYFQNILREEKEPKYRVIKLSNRLFQEVWKEKDCQNLLFSKTLSFSLSL